MPLDEKDKAEVLELFKTKLPEVLTPALTEHVNGALSPVLQKLEKMEKESPGMFKRIASETMQELTKAAGGAGGAGGDGGGKKKTSDEIEELKAQNIALAKQFEEQTKTLAAKDTETELRKHIRGDPKTPIKWFDEQEAIDALLPLIGKSASGKLGVTIKKQVGNAEIDEFLPLPAAVQWLAGRKAHWIDGEARGGSGAAGGDGTGAKVSVDAAEKMTWDEIQSTPGLVNQLFDEGKQELLTKKKREHLLKMRADKGKQGGNPRQRLSGMRM
jgi:hypothetical protein